MSATVVIFPVGSANRLSVGTLLFPTIVAVTKPEVFHAFSFGASFVAVVVNVSLKLLLSLVIM
jgi:hypothetical protein